MKTIHLAILAAVSTSLVSSVGAYCQTKGNTDLPSDGNPGGDPTMPSPPIITIKPITMPILHAMSFYNPATGSLIVASFCISPYFEVGEGQLHISLNQPVNAVSATVTNLSTGQTCVVSSVTSTDIYALLRGNGLYEVRISTSCGEYIGTIMVSNLPGWVPPCDTIEGDAASGGSLFPNP